MIYHGPDDLAQRLDVPREWVMRRVRTGEFPHLRLGRYVRFTDEHVRQIEAAHEVSTPRGVGDVHGRKTRRAS